VCLWLERFLKRLSLASADILRDTHVDDNWNSPKRLLERAGFRGIRFKKFLRRLEAESLPPIWRTCGREYSSTVLGRSNAE
jgi:hypothetical protein